MDALSSHISMATIDGRLEGGKINGVVRYKTKKGKRMQGQGEAGTDTGSGKNKNQQGNFAEGKPRTKVKAQPILPTKMPKKAAAKAGKPKKVNKFLMAFEAAKKSLATSTDSRAAAAGRRPTKSPSVSSPGAGID